MGVHRKGLVLGLALSVLVPAAASANTVKMGSELTLPDDGGISGANTLSIQTAVAAPLNPIVSPANGIVTEWKVKTKDVGSQQTLRILRPAGLNLFTGAGSAPAPALVPNTVAPTGTILTYAVSLPIKQGDYIGLLQTGAGANDLPQNITNGITGNVISNDFNGNLLLDGGAARTFTPDQQHELLLQATVKFCKVPDLTGKKTAEAQLLLTAADCAAGPSTKKKLKRSKKNKKKKGTVLKQTVAAGTTGAPGTAVGFTVGKLKKKK